MPILEMQHVGKVYGGVTKALNDVSFQIEEGEFVSIIGPSGVVLLDGQDITHVSGKALRNVRTKTNDLPAL